MPESPSCEGIELNPLHDTRNNHETSQRYGSIGNSHTSIKQSTSAECSRNVCLNADDESNDNKSECTMDMIPATTEAAQTVDDEEFYDENQKVSIKENFFLMM